MTEDNWVTAQEDIVPSLLSSLDRLRQELAYERAGHFACAEVLRELRDFCGCGLITTELCERIDAALNPPLVSLSSETPNSVDGVNNGE